MTNQQILQNQISTDLQLLANDIQVGMYDKVGSLEIWYKEFKRISDKITKLFREENDCSEEFPIGGRIEPHDIEKEKEMCH